MSVVVCVGVHKSGREHFFFFALSKLSFFFFFAITTVQASQFFHSRSKTAHLYSVLILCFLHVLLFFPPFLDLFVGGRR